jgi:putative transposase
MLKNRKPNRLRGYDYSKNNLYFVTICVQDRICCFGDIIVGTGRDPFVHDPFACDPSVRKIVLNEYGKIVENQWLWLGEQYPYVVLHAFVVMPNHIHGIIEIDRSRIKSPSKIKLLSELMGAYKTNVSKQIHMIGFIEFKWQRSFYEHIIRDYKSFESISDYIKNNPAKWMQDNFFKF